MTAVRLKGVNGIFMVNENGNICFSSRIIKTNDGMYRVETMTTDQYTEFENKLEKAIF